MSLRSERKSEPARTSSGASFGPTSSGADASLIRVATFIDHLDPVNAVLCLVLDPPRDFRRQRATPQLSRFELDPLFGLLNSHGALAGLRVASLRSSSGRISGTPERCPNPAVEPGRLAVIPVFDPDEEILGRRSGSLHLMNGGIQMVSPEEPSVCPFVRQPGEHEINAQARDLQTEVLTGDRFERVGLVENCHVVFRQQFESRRPAARDR